MKKVFNNQIELTKEGLEEIKAELTELVEIKLPAIIVRVAKAREHGDLSENAEYHSARDDQQLLQARIDELQNIVDNFCNSVIHLIITCNIDGELASYKTPNKKQIVILPPETNDNSLAMTSSYSGMLLAGILIAKIKEILRFKRETI